MTDSPTPQTRDDGLSAEDTPSDDERAKRVMIRLREMQNRQGEDYIWRTAKEAADVIAALLSHKQQGRNEGLEEAAQRAEGWHLRVGGTTVTGSQLAVSIRALISPLPKPEETKGEKI